MLTACAFLISIPAEPETTPKLDMPPVKVGPAMSMAVLLARIESREPPCACLDRARDAPCSLRRGVPRIPLAACEQHRRPGQLIVERRFDGARRMSAYPPARSITTETPAKTVDQMDQHYKCSGYNPGKYPDTRRMVFASRTGSRDIAHDRYLCIAVWRSEPPQR
jgi:hypothetical protein